MTIKELKKQAAAVEQHRAFVNKQLGEMRAELAVSFSLVFHSLPGSLRSKASRMGMSAAYLSDICSARRNPSDAVIKALEKIK